MTFYVFNDRINEVQTYGAPKKLTSIRHELNTPSVYLLNGATHRLPEVAKNVLRKIWRARLDKMAERAASKAS